jgi:hypothetical protein
MSGRNRPPVPPSNHNSTTSAANGLLDAESVRSAVMSDVMNRLAFMEAKTAQQQQQQQQQQTPRRQPTTSDASDDGANDSADGAMSHLTDDAKSQVSRLSTLSISNVSHILSTAKMILQGENPSDNHVIDEEEGERGIDIEHEESDYTNLKNGGEILVPMTDSMMIRQSRNKSKSVNMDEKEGKKNRVDNGDDDDAEDDQEMYDFLLDNKCEMTWGRRIGVTLSNKTWYNPSLLQVVDIKEEVDEAQDKAVRDEKEVHAVKSLVPKSFSSADDDDDEEAEIVNGLLLGKSKSGSTTTNNSDRNNSPSFNKRSKKAQAEWTRLQQQERQKQMERAMLKNEAYPFTHSQKEQPSLAKAWACTYTLILNIECVGRGCILRLRAPARVFSKCFLSVRLAIGETSVCF